MKMKNTPVTSRGTQSGCIHRNSDICPHNNTKSEELINMVLDLEIEAEEASETGKGQEVIDYIYKHQNGKTKISKETILIYLECVDRGVNT